MKTILSRDGANESPWQQGLPSVMGTVPSNIIQTVYDCLVIGAGITGFTTALMLKKAGKNVMLVDASSPGFGTTGGTSAHINNFADTTFKEAESAFGEKGAQLFASAITEGAGIIGQNVKDYKIECDYEDKTAYIYAEDDNQVKQLTSVYDGLVQVGIKAEFVDDVPIPIPFKTAVKVEGQAQFHPLKYLLGLQKQYLALGGDLMENVRIEKISSENGVHTAESSQITIKAKNIVYATHMPPNINVLNVECAPYRSYVLGVKLKNDKYPDALVYDLEDPYHYFRTHEIDGEKLLIAGGNDHKTGHDDPEKVFNDLENYVRKYFSVSSVKYKWSSQYYIPVDGLPYIGQMPLTAKGIYCATGYNGNGMMFGSVAGKILSDLVISGDSVYKDLFDPCRVKPIDSFTEFVTENADVAYHFVADRFKIHDTDSLKRIAAGTGKVVEVDGKKVAAYRDEKGEIHALNPICTHMKCVVNWNQEEKSWDCPCHGARFDIDGKVLTGPATVDLGQIQ